MSTTTELLYDETDLDQEEFERLATALTDKRYTCRKLGKHLCLETWCGQTDAYGLPTFAGVIQLTFCETVLRRACIAPIRDGHRDEAKRYILEFLSGMRWGG